MLEFKNGKFRIMQIADIQELPQVNSDSIKIIKLAIQKEQPDLIIFSGDQIYGIMPQYKINTEKKIRNTISEILKPIIDAGIPFAVTFGNHDKQCGIPNIKQADIYSDYKGFIASSAFEDSKKGVCTIPIFDKGKQVFNIVLIDSNGQMSSGEYEPVNELQLQSFTDQQNIIKKNTSQYLPFICIQHIPVEEYFNVIKKVPFYTKGAVEGFRNHRHQFFILDKIQVAEGGFMFESPATPDKNSGEFDVLTKNGNCLALSVGHDHNNSFVAKYKGTDLIYTQGCGFNVYGPKLDRGVRIFDINNSNSHITYSTHTVTFRELTNDKVSKPLKEFILTHIPTSMEQVKEIALIFGIAGFAGSAVYYSRLKKLK